MSYRLKLDAFEGPLDLLLHLIKMDEVDIRDISLARVTDQYLGYLKLMEELNLEIASEFLVMAATLLEIKSQTLLPVGEETEFEGDEADLRWQLVEQILEYKRYKEAAEQLEARESRESEVFYRSAREDVEAYREPSVEADIFDLLQALQKVMTFAAEEPVQQIALDEYTVEQKIGEIRRLLKGEKFLWFDGLFGATKSKHEIIVTFLALLELIHLNEVKAIQKELFGEIKIVRTEGGTEKDAASATDTAAVEGEAPSED